MNSIFAIRTHPARIVNLVAHCCFAFAGLDDWGNECINPHNGYVNYLFPDWSVHKVGRKELWTLRWFKDFDTHGPWTSAGGVRPTSRPLWMRQFRDY